MSPKIELILSPPGFNHGGSYTFSPGPTAIKTRGGIVRSVGCGLLAIPTSPIHFSASFTVDRGIVRPCYSTQLISYHRISLNFPNPISALQDKANHNQCMKEPSRVTVLGKGVLYSISKTSQLLQRPPLCHISRYRPFFQRSAQIQSTHASA